MPPLVTRGHPRGSARNFFEPFEGLKLHFGLVIALVLSCSIRPLPLSDLWFLWSRRLKRFGVLRLPCALAPCCALRYGCRLTLDASVYRSWLKVCSYFTFGPTLCRDLVHELYVCVPPTSV